mgnify:CR=1 FL=1
MDLNQYDIILVNLDPTVGSEIKKTRPCLIISPDEINFNLQTIVIAPITKTSKKYPTRVNVINNNTTSWIAIDQIRTIDKSRVLKNLGQLSKEKISEIKFVIKETFVD